MGQGDQLPERGEPCVRLCAGGGSGGLRGGPAGGTHEAVSQRAEGGGFHHCSSDRGGGFCAYADITLAIKFLFERVEGISRATIVDLDAHQGNGHERDFMGDQRVYIMDVYNRHIYPGDRFAKQAIRRKVELEWGTEDDEYLGKVERNLERALQEHPPDVMVYNAGTDILEGDRLGGLSVSPQGIVKRDELVFRVARGRRVPILMVTSGGYQKRTARIIADSILNLFDLGLIGPKPPSTSAQDSDTCLLSQEVRTLRRDRGRPSRAAAGEGQSRTPGKASARRPLA
ncbi:histone deacetylase 11 isoform 2-T6 [Molossus nigricans]